MRDNFVVFILTHGRPDNVKTLKTLQKQGYTGKYFLVVDDEDSTLNEYKRLYGDKVLVFNKDEVAKKNDLMDNFKEKNVIFFARNVCFDLAEKLGYRYFLELDDDYVKFEIRYVENNKFIPFNVKNLNELFELMLVYLDESKATSVALAQTGDFIGGPGSQLWTVRIKRKAMNSFFCDTTRKFSFLGRINEDVNTYVKLGSMGNLFITIRDADLIQTPTQANASGMSDTYLKLGTYVKSFYSVMLNPSSVKISMMITEHQRMHHQIDWDCAVPKIISDRFRK